MPRATKVAKRFTVYIYVFQSGSSESLLCFEASSTPCRAAISFSFKRRPWTLVSSWFSRGFQGRGASFRWFSRLKCVRKWAETRPSRRRSSAASMRMRSARPRTCSRRRSGRWGEEKRWEIDGESIEHVGKTGFFSRFLSSSQAFRRRTMPKK